MYDRIKPIIREFYPNHLILYVGTNELDGSKTLSLNSKKSTVTISAIVSRKDSLNNKTHGKTADL